MQIASAAPPALTAWLFAAVVLFAMPPATTPSPRPSLDLVRERFATELRELQRMFVERAHANVPVATSDSETDPCRALHEWATTGDDHTDEYRDDGNACRDIERYLSAADPSMTADKLWDAYDRVALAHFNAVGDARVNEWIQASPNGIAVGGRVAAGRVLVAWSDPMFLAGARASMFVRGRGQWTVVAHRTLDLAGQHVSLQWSRGGVFLIGGVFQGADAAWLSLIGLDARGSSIRVKPVATHLWAGDGHDTTNGLVVHTIVAPKHFITHLFENWREQEVTVEWTGIRFRTTRRETEPVIAALETYCAHRSACAKATLQDVERVTERRVRAVFTAMPNDCEYGKPAVAVELAKTDRWRVVGLECRPE